jgi:hypothetical protein
VGEILSPSNFVAIPQEIVNDPVLFFDGNLNLAAREIDAHLSVAVK